MNLASRDEQISADVLVLGGGLGGCFAAIKAAKAGAKVVVFEKANILRSGSNSTGSGRITLIHPDYNHSFEEFARLNVETGGGIVDEDLSCEFAKHTLDRVLELERYGIKIRRDDGSFFMMRGPDIAPGEIVFWPPGPKVWQDIKPVLAKQVMEYENIAVLNRTAAIGLLTRDGAIGSDVVGALGLGTRTGQFVTCEAKAVVLTSGNSHRLARHHDTCYAPSRFITVSPPTNCGDGQAMAYRAGADIVNMEFAYMARIWKDFAHAGVGQTTGAGGKSITGTGAELSIADRYRLTHQGAYNTQGPMYVDPRDVEGWPKDRGMMKGLIWAEANESTSLGYFKWMEERGEHLTKGPIEIEWRPPALHNNQGGIHIDVNARSSLKGLYCAGDVIGGGWRQAGTGACVYGAIAGKNAAEYAGNAQKPEINPVQLASEKNRILNALDINPSDGYSWIELEDKIRSIATDYGPPFTNDALLERGLVRLGRITTRYLPKIYARDPREMMRVSEVQAISVIVEAFLRAALFRKESRLNPCTLLHKTDYPERDDKNWLKHTLLRNLDGEMTVSSKELKRLKKEWNKAKKDGY